MGAYVLIGGLWAAVFGYWLWTRRPSTADTVGLFRRELGVLRTASPQTVVPANRLDPNRPVVGSRLAVGGTAKPDPLTAAAVSHRRMEMRKRRRDILCMLGGAAVLTLLVAVLTGSGLVIGLQVLCDLAFGGYVALLFRTAVAQVGYSAAQRRYTPGIAQARLARTAAGRQAISEPPVRDVTPAQRYDDTDYFASAVLTGVARPPLAARVARRSAAAAPGERSASRMSASRASVPLAQARPVGRHSRGPAGAVDFDLTTQDGDQETGAYGDFDDYEALAIAN